MQSLETAVVATEVQLAWQANKPSALQVGGLVSTGRQRAIAAMHEATELGRKLDQLEDAAMQCFSGKAELVEEHRVSQTPQRASRLSAVRLTPPYALLTGSVGAAAGFKRKTAAAHRGSFGGNHDKSRSRKN